MNTNTTTDSVINRREALRRTAWVMGGMLTAPTIAAILKGCTAETVLNWKPTLFTEMQAQAITRLADIILPKTDTPGAVEAGVPAFIEQVVKDCYTEEDKNRFIEDLNAFIANSEERYGKDFLHLSAEKQEAYLLEVHRLAVEKEKARKEGYKRPFILKCKELTMAGFFTSEPGATQVLQYVAVPGSYNGCISLEEAGGKTWAT